MHASRSTTLAAALALTATTVLAGPQFVQAASPDRAGDLAAAAEGAVEVQVLATNDFHGRLGPAPQLAQAVRDLEAVHPNTVFAAAGDLIGASTFESFIAMDKPTIDVLNAAGLDVSAVGNHEFDQGLDDLLDRVMAPYDPETNPYGGAEWAYIGANVRYRDTGDPAIDGTWVKEFDDVEVGFIGAVTEHLPELVTPSGIADIEVTDIVEATNEAADDLKAEGVDLVLLLVHEGAPSTDCATMADDPTSDFGGIITGVNANVDAIVSGHTHLAYNCAFEVPEWSERAVTERPVVSAGQYGQHLNQLLFTLDGDTGELLASEQYVLAEIYAQALEAAGYEVGTDLGLGDEQQRDQVTADDEEHLDAEEPAPERGRSGQDGAAGDSPPCATAVHPPKENRVPADPVASRPGLPLAARRPPPGRPPGHRGPAPGLGRSHPQRPGHHGRRGAGMVADLVRAPGGGRGVGGAGAGGAPLRRARSAPGPAGRGGLGRGGRRPVGGAGPSLRAAARAAAVTGAGTVPGAGVARPVVGGPGRGRCLDQWCASAP
jgi:hypothetical protein